MGVAVLVAAVLVAVALLAGVGIGRSLPGAGGPAKSTGSVGAGGSAGAPGAGPAGRSGSGASGSGASGSGSSGTGTSGGVSGNRPSAGIVARPPTAARVAADRRQITPETVDLYSSLAYEGLQAAGTGIVIGADGLVLTNNHVIDGSTSLVGVDLGTKRRYRAVVLGYDTASDVAVVRLVGASRLPVAPLAGAAARVGERVVAVGNAGGKGGTPTAAGGTVTGLDRSITATDRVEGTTEHLSGLIETSADVQLGDSGGPLLDASGRVVGMDTAAAQGFSFAGSGNEGFAIPIGTAVGIARTIEEGRGSAAVHVGATAFLGVRAARATCPSSATSVRSGSGALVCAVLPGSAAAGAGLAGGDLITALSGRAVSGPAQLSHLLVVGFRPGQVVTVSYRSAGGKGAPRAVRATLRSGPPA